MSKSVKNYTFSLPIDLLSKIKHYSNEGRIPSVNAAVKEAIENYVKTVEKQNLYIEMKEAAIDPLFMDDLENAMNDFSHTDFEAIEDREKQ